MISLSETNDNEVTMIPCSGFPFAKSMLPLLLCMALLNSSSAHGAATKPLSRDSVVEKVRKAALAMQRESWEQGVLAQAFVEEGDDQMIVMMAQGSLIHQTDDGRVAAIGGAMLDPLMCGEAMWRAGQISGDPALQKAAAGLLEFALKRAPRAADGTLFHTGHTLWSDSCHTAPSFFAVTGHYEEAIQQLEGYRKRLWNPNKRLFSNIWGNCSTG